MSLELIVGPMFSGKSTELIKRVRRLQTIHKTYIVYNSLNDDRYGLDGIYTHDMNSVPCVSVNHLMGQINTERFREAEYILIDEAQFFKDLFKCDNLRAHTFNNLGLSFLRNDMKDYIN